MSTKTMMPPTPRELGAIFADFERRCGTHAPIAFLVYLQHCPQPASCTYLFTGKLRDLLLEREIALFHARADDHLAHIRAHQHCCEAIRIAIQRIPALH